MRPAARLLSGTLRTAALGLALSLALGIGKPVLERSVYLGRLLAMQPPPQVAHPVPNARGRLRDSWHASRNGGRRHEGIDIFAPRGSPVRATTEGIVLRRGQNRLGGKVVWVLGPGGHRHYYAHLDAYSQIRTGERIVAGTPVGYVGDSGNAKGTPTHLHYGIYTTSGAVNPYPYIRERRPERAPPQ
ncbi:MAG TPA: M23 family metallopeptidase [Noviherbaspirillum sp.]|jgi:murein DD-endopeptidase MepM/ murein hydrolase activator NlpD|uniref:M23 family metallopeptidase n=1 Tax=Noviherbaspirillum sp. TaxID=1926288 RepID=UPI002F9242F4